MTAINDELERWVRDTLDSEFTRRDGQKIPSTDELKLGNDAVDLDGTVLYADLSGSTKLVEDYRDWFAAKVYKSYLYAAARVIRSKDGVITAYDGDRIMAVFIGGSKNSNAVKAALKINYAVDKIIQPAIDSKKYTSPYQVKHTIGIDSSKLMIARTGIRGSNDLVWIGNAANYAAKLSDLKLGKSVLISGRVHGNMHESARYGGKPRRDMWTDLGSQSPIGRVYGSSWRWTV